jgi:hypothetical protein
VRFRHFKMRQAVSRIVGALRMSKMRNSFLLLRRSTIRIQTYFRKFLERHKNKFYEMNRFMIEEKSLEKSRCFRKKDVIERGFLKILEDKQINFLEKIKLQSVLVDYEVFDEFYDWEKGYLEAVSESLKKLNPPMYYSLGESHACLAGTQAKIYVWGDNYNGQLGHPVSSR